MLSNGSLYYVHSTACIKNITDLYKTFNNVINHIFQWRTYNSQNKQEVCLMNLRKKSEISMEST